MNAARSKVKAGGRRILDVAAILWCWLLALTATPASAQTPMQLYVEAMQPGWNLGYAIERSTDLVTWQVVANGTVTTPAGTFTETQTQTNADPLLPGATDRRRALMVNTANAAGQLQISCPGRLTPAGSCTRKRTASPSASARTGATSWIRRRPIR